MDVPALAVWLYFLVESTVGLVNNECGVAEVAVASVTDAVDSVATELVAVGEIVRVCRTLDYLVADYAADVLCELCH